MKLSFAEVMFLCSFTIQNASHGGLRELDLVLEIWFI